MLQRAQRALASNNAGLSLNDVDAVGFSWNLGIHAEAVSSKLVSVPRDHLESLHAAPAHLLRQLDDPSVARVEQGFHLHEGKPLRLRRRLPRTNLLRSIEYRHSIGSFVRVSPNVSAFAPTAVKAKSWAWPRTANPRTAPKLMAALGPAREPDGELTQRYMNIAASLQRVTEDSLLHVGRMSSELTEEGRWCIAGDEAPASTSAASRSCIPSVMR